MSYQFRHATCNEVFQNWTLTDTCRAIRKAGYSGIEIAPFTLAEDPSKIPAARRREYAAVIQSEGLEFVGLHWLLVAPKGLHVTTGDKALRRRSWEFIGHLVDLCADLAGNKSSGNGVMVFGSPQQRATTGGMSGADAAKNYLEGLQGVAPHAEERGVTILIEALPRAQCDVIMSMEEAVAGVRQINSPAVRTMFDTHNAVDEAEAHAVLVDRHFDFIRHIHVNELDGRHPGAGDYNFRPVLEVLQRRNYAGWVSLEVFDFSPGAEKIIHESLRHLESEIAKVPA